MKYKILYYGKESKKVVREEIVDTDGYLTALYEAKNNVKETEYVGLVVRYNNGK